MGKFYLPELIVIENRTPVIVYLCEGVEGLVDRTNNHQLKFGMNQVYESNQIPKDPFSIAIVWENRGNWMTDVWRYTQLENWGSGALATATTFRGNVPDNTCGTSAEFGLSVLGREAEHRMGKTLKEFLETRPVLHPATTNYARFFKGK